MLIISTFRHVLRKGGNHGKGLRSEEAFTLDKNSNGINPVTENVTLLIGTFSVTIPAGTFQQNPNGRFAFQGAINGVSLGVQIVPLGNNIFTFKAEDTGVSLTGLTNPGHRDTNHWDRFRHHHRDRAILVNGQLLHNCLIRVNPESVIGPVLRQGGKGCPQTPQQSPEKIPRTRKPVRGAPNR
jgi:hypothetical protein